jgi:hypothetical protein
MILAFAGKTTNHFSLSTSLSVMPKDRRKTFGIVAQHSDVKMLEQAQGFEGHTDLLAIETLSRDRPGQIRIAPLKSSDAYRKRLNTVVVRHARLLGCVILRGRRRSFERLWPYNAFVDLVWVRIVVSRTISLTYLGSA